MRVSMLTFDLVRVPTSFCPPIEEVLLPKLLGVPVESAADPAGVLVPAPAQQGGGAEGGAWL